MPHTPGPWTVEPNINAPGARVVSSQNGHVASLRATPHRLANARLIAAAPQLVDLAGAFLWLMNRVAGWDEKTYPPITTFAAQIYADQAKAIIAKAEGREA